LNIVREELTRNSNMDAATLDRTITAVTPPARRTGDPFKVMFGRFCNVLVYNAMNDTSTMKDSRTVSELFDNMRIPSCVHSVVVYVFEMGFQLRKITKLNVNTHYTTYNTLIKEEAEAEALVVASMTSTAKAPVASEK